MADVTSRVRHVFSGLDLDKALIVGTVGDLYHATNTGIKYFWNGALSSWDNGHKQRIRALGRGVPDIGMVVGVVWTRFKSIIFRGSNLEGIPINIKVYFGSVGPGTFTVRVQDITNATTIASLAGLSGAVALYDLGAIANIPTAFAEWELQVLPTGTGNTAIVNGVNMYFN